MPWHGNWFKGAVQTNTKDTAHAAYSYKVIFDLSNSGDAEYLETVQDREVVSMELTHALLVGVI